MKEKFLDVLLYVTRYPCTSQHDFFSQDFSTLFVLALEESLDAWVEELQTEKVSWNEAKDSMKDIWFTPQLETGAWLKKALGFNEIVTSGFVHESTRS
jgi:hypothetical protein